jgi:DNA invertase Pin-like site-specific DNA recombinase
MPQRTFQPKQPTDLSTEWYTPLPIESRWGIYARQSTPAQVTQNIQSTEMQTEDLQAWLIAKGVAEEHISLFDADLGLSGTLRIDQRTGLQELLERIEADQIKAVLVYQISRLFRDETGVQYNVFAQICKEHHCLLVTSDGMIFNFNLPMHLKMFRYLGEMAAEYIPQQIKGILLAARTRKARKGLYAGLGSIPVGYVVDYEKESPTYLKYIPYEPHARVIRWIYERYYELAGDHVALSRELNALPVLFPHFAKDVDRRIVSRCLLRKLPGGYHLSRPGLVQLLANPTYLGWWIVQGDIISRENHEPIIDGEHAYQFWYAFDRLSPYTTSGERNHKREVRPVRFTHKATKEKGGLLKNRITSCSGAVYVHLKDGKHRYHIVPETSTSLVRAGENEITAEVIDTAFTNRFFERLAETHDFDEYRRFLEEETAKQTSLTTTLNQQLSEIERQQEAILDEKLAIHTRIRELTDAAQRAQAEQDAQPDLERLRNRSAKLNKLAAELSAKLPKPEENQQLQKARKLADFQTEVQKLLPVWDQKPFTVRREFVNLFVSQAIVAIVSTHWISLTIEWSLPAWETDILYIYRTRGATPSWTQEEQEIINRGGKSHVHAVCSHRCSRAAK